MPCLHAFHSFLPFLHKRLQRMRIIRSRWRYWLAKPHMDGVLSHQKPSFRKRRAGAVNVQRNDYGLGLCGQVKSAFFERQHRSVF